MAEGELSALRWDDLHDVAKDTEIPTAKVTKALRQSRARLRHAWAPTKTENRVRVLPVHSLAAGAPLRAWHAGWADSWAAPGRIRSGLPERRGRGTWRPNMATMLREDLLAAGLPDRYEGHPYTAHATRRSFATWLSEAAVAEGTIKRLMGHAAGDVTALHYTAQTLRTLRDAVESIKLDLSRGEVVALPIRAVAGALRGRQRGRHEARKLALLPRFLPTRPAVCPCGKELENRQRFRASRD